MTHNCVCCNSTTNKHNTIYVEINAGSYGGGSDSELEGEIESLGLQIKELNDELNALNSKLDQLNTENSNLKNDKSELNKEINFLKQQIATLEQQINQLNIDKENLNKTIESLNSNIVDLNSQIDTLNKEKQNIQSQLNDANNTISTLNYKIEELNNKINKLESDLEAEKEKTGKLTSENESLTNENTELTSQIDDLTNNNLELAENNRQLAENNNKLIDKVEELSKSLDFNKFTDIDGEITNYNNLSMNILRGFLNNKIDIDNSNTGLLFKKSLLPVDEINVDVTTDMEKIETFNDATIISNDLTVNYKSIYNNTFPVRYYTRTFNFRTNKKDSLKEQIITFNIDVDLVQAYQLTNLINRYYFLDDANIYINAHIKIRNDVFQSGSGGNYIMCNDRTTDSYANINSLLLTCDTEVNNKNFTSLYLAGWCNFLGNSFQEFLTNLPNNLVNSIIYIKDCTFENPDYTNELETATNKGWTITFI